MDDWFIKIHRSILKWEWYDDIPTKTLFLHLLLTVNYVDWRWRGIDIPRGGRITSLSKLAKECGLSIQSVRTSINKLKSTQEVTQYQHSDYTFIQLNNWSKYQWGVTQLVTQKQHSGNNNIRREEGKKIPITYFEEFLKSVDNENLKQSLRDWWEYKKGKYTELWWKKTISIALKYNSQDVCSRIDEAISSGWIGMNLDTMKNSEMKVTPKIRQVDPECPLKGTARMYHQSDQYYKEWDEQNNNNK